uniref:Uncharacterized protein n=1 Tax=Aureoumbra lagunensis TaxID=44058 RepID=A0A7S3JZ20_9STRA
MEMFAEAEDNYPVKSFVPEIIQSSPLAVSELNDQVNDLKDSHRVKRARIGEKACVEAQSDQSLPPVSLVPRGSAKRWSQEEEALLFSLIQELGQGKWAIIAQRLGTGRTPSGIEQHWQIMCGRRRRNHKSDIKSNFIQQHVSSIEQSQAYHNGFSSIQLEGSPMHVQYSPTSIQQEDEKHFSSQGDSSSSIGVSASIVPALVPIHRLPSVNKQQIQQSLPTDVNRIQTNSATSTLASTIASTMIQENYKVARRWTADEEIRLSALVEQLGRGKWRAIAQALGTGRSASAVEQHWQIQIGQRKRNTSSSRKSHQQQKQQQQRQQQLQQHVPNEQTSDSQGLIYGALPRRPLDDDDDDDDDDNNVSRENTSILLRPLSTGTSPLLALGGPPPVQVNTTAPGLSHHHRHSTFHQSIRPISRGVFDNSFHHTFNNDTSAAESAIDGLAHQSFPLYNPELF